MPVVGRLESGQLLVREDVAGPASYATATPPTVTFNDLAQGIESVVAVMSDDGRGVQVVDATPAARIATFRVRGLDAAGAADGDPLLEVPDATNLSGSIYTFLAVGR